MRMAKYRARNERFDLNLPPLENMHAVQSALSQLVEAVAADMIDLKRAHFLLSALRQAANHFKYQDAWQPSAYHNDQSQPHPEKYDNFEAEYGLPENLDLATPPEVAFPPPASDVGSDEVGCPIPPSLGGVGPFSDLSPMPSAGACEHGPDCPELVIRADHPVTPEAVEIIEVLETYGSDAAARRGGQLSRNKQRRLQTSNHKRYAAIALEKNMRIAAEMLAQRKLAERAARAAQPTAEKENVGCPIPPSFGGVGTFPDATRKPAASATLHPATHSLQRRRKPSPNLICRIGVFELAPKAELRPGMS